MIELSHLSAWLRAAHDIGHNRHQTVPMVQAVACVPELGTAAPSGGQGLKPWPLGDAPSASGWGLVATRVIQVLELLHSLSLLEGAQLTGGQLSSEELLQVLSLNWTH